jgi:hypothetical protein
MAGLVPAIGVFKLEMPRGMERRFGENGWLA